MNNVIKWTLLACLAMGGTVAMGQLKLGFIDSYELFQAMPERDSVNTKLEAYAAELQEQIEVMEVEYNTKLQDYLKVATTLNDAVRTTRESELRGIQTRLQETSQVFQRDLAQMEQTMLAPVSEKMNNAIGKVARANGMTAVLDLSAGTLIYHDPATMTDMLPLVKAELGIP